MRKKEVYLRRPVLLFLLVTAIIGTVSPCSAAAETKADLTPVLIIDPGHGGLDGGAVASDGTKESAVNLAIALRLRDLCLLLGIPCLMTRTGEELPYPAELSGIREKKVWDQRRRIDLVNETENAILLSIHQNYYPDDRPSGTQVIYGSEEASACFGGIVHELLRSSLCPENRRVASPAPESIYLLRQARRPAILAECGFLSNPAELALLRSPEYQTKIAAILLAGFQQYLQSKNEIPSPDGGTTDERKNDVLLYELRK